MNNISFKQRVCQSIIDQSKIYKKIFIDRQYLICSKCFTNRKYYILVANKDNYLHLVGVHTTLTPSEFFEKCFNDTLTENDFDFSKKHQSEKSVKGSVRRKISALEDEKYIKERQQVLSFCTSDIEFIYEYNHSTCRRNYYRK